MKKTSIKGIVYIIISIVVYFGSNFFLSPIDTPSPLTTVIRPLLIMVSVLFLISGIRNILFSKAQEENGPITPVKNKKSGVVFVVFGLILSTSIFSLQAVFCKSGDFVCGIPVVGLGMFFTAGGILLIIKGFRKIFSDKKIF